MAYLKWGLLVLTVFLAAILVLRLWQARTASKRVNNRRPTSNFDFPSSSFSVFDPVFDSPRSPSRQQKRRRVSLSAVLFVLTTIFAIITLLFFLNVLGLDKQDDAKPSDLTVKQGISLASRHVTLPSEEFTSAIERYQTRYEYDPAGNLKTRVDANGSVVSFAYDTLNRLTSVTYPDSLSITFTYNGAGQRTQMLDELGTTLYDYDIHGRVIAVTDPNGSPIHYEYEPRGYISQISYGGKAVYYEWDDNGQLIVIDDSNVGSIHYSYDRGGNLIERTLPNGIKTIYQYDQANRLTTIQHNDARNNLLLELAYEFDVMGNRTRLTRTTADGISQITDYTYNDLYRLARVVYPDGETVTYDYDRDSNCISTTSSVTGQSAYAYDSLGRLISSKNAQGTTTFTYDNSGNLIQRQTPQETITYTWDYENRLIGVSDSSHTIQFRYDGDGRRLSKNVDGQETLYIQHGQILPQVLVEQTGGQTIQFLPGLPHSGQMSGADVQYYLEDGLGSIVGLTDAAGQLTNLLDYDAFGAQRNPANLPVHIGFAGEMLDAETGLIYLRNRYYDPTLGRFISANFQLAQPYNPYIYAQNNPVNYTNPSGLQDDRFRLVSLPDMPLPYPPRRYADLIWTMHDVQPRYANGPGLMEQTEAVSDSLIGLPIPGNALDVTQAPRLVNSIHIASNEQVTPQLFTTLSALNPNISLNPYWLSRSASGLVFAGMTSDVLTDTLIQNLTSSDLPDLYSTGTRGGISLSQIADELAQLTDIISATYDLQTEQIVLIGRSDDTMPPISADDLAVALRSIYRGELPSVSIEPCTPGAQDNCMKVHYNDRFIDPTSTDETWLTYNAAGHLIMAEPPAAWNTHFGFTLFEADRYLKTASLGEDNLSNQPFVTRVSGFASELDLIAARAASDSTYTIAADSQCRIWSEVDRNTPSACHRMWFVPRDNIPQADDDDYSITLRITDDNQTVMFDPVVIWTDARFVRFDSSGQMVDVPGDDPAVQAFVDFFNLHYNDFAQEKPELAELVQLAKLVGLVRWMQDKNIPVDLGWLDEYELNTVETPAQTMAITVQTNAVPGQSLMLYGGVALDKPVRYLPGGDELRVLTNEALDARPSPASFAWDFPHGSEIYQVVAFNPAPTSYAGAYHAVQEDMKFPFGDFGLSLVRVYNSLDASRPGLFGRGWTMQSSSLTFKAVPSPDDPNFQTSQLLLDNNGQQTVFHLMEDGNFRAESMSAAADVIGIATPNDPFTPRPFVDGYILMPGGAGQPISMRTTDGTPVEYGGFVLQQGDIVSAYNTFGQLIGQRNTRTGRELTITLDQNGRPVTLQQPDGSRMDISYNTVNGFVEKAQLFTGEIRYYRYKNDYLSEVTGTDGKPIFKYEYTASEDGTPRLSRILDSEDHTLEAMEFDALGRVTRVQSRTDFLDANYASEKDVVYTNAAGQQASRLFDDEHRLVKETGFDTSFHEFHYSENGNKIIAITDQNGTTQFSYTDNYLTGITAPDGSTQQYMQLRPDGWPQAVVGPTSHMMLSNYGSGYEISMTTGLRLEQTQPDGTISYTEVDPVNMKFFYEGQNHKLTGVQLPNGSKVGYQRDEVTGNLTRIVQANGVPIAVTTNEQQNILTVTYDTGYTITFAYTPEGQISSITLPSGTFTYDYDQGLLTSFTDAAGRTHNYVYGRSEMLERIIDANSGETIYEAEVQENKIIVPTASGGYLEWTVDNNRITDMTLVAVPQNFSQSVLWITGESFHPGIALDFEAKTKVMR